MDDRIEEQQISELPIEAPPILKQEWDIGDLRQHFDSRGSIPSLENMPENIDIGENMFWHIQSDVCKGYDYFSEDKRDKFEGTEYQKYEYRFNTGMPVRILVYRNEQAPDSPVPKFAWPPEIEFLMPILEYNRVRAGKAQGMVLASSDVILLALRTKFSTVLTSRSVEPVDAEHMHIPPFTMPRGAYVPYRLPTSSNLSRSEIRMRSFIEQCKHTHIAVYAKKTFTSEHEGEQDSILTRLDWADIT